MSPVLWRFWSFPLPVVAALLGVAAGYALLWRGSGARPAGALAFAGGLAVLALALFSPIDTVGECCLISVHMLQHVLLLLAGPVLLLLGARGVLPPGRGPLGRAAARLTQPVVALPLLLANLYLWHLPAAYEAALRWRAVHDLQHLLYLTTGLLYWWAVVDPAPLAGRTALTYGRKLGYLLTGAVAMMPLGLLLMWWPQPLYPHYAVAARAAGQSALYDQQLAALLMLGSGGTLLVAALLAGLAALGGSTAAGTRQASRPGG